MYPIFTQDVLIRAIQSKPASFFRDAVRYLNFVPHHSTFISTIDIKTILSACCGVVDLVVHGGFLPDSHSLPLRRLSISLWHIFEYKSIDFLAPPPSVDFTQPNFSHLTHLDMRDYFQVDSEADNMAGLATLPQLTHLSFNVSRIFRVFYRILTSSASLQILLLFTPHRVTSRTLGAEENLDLLQDVRFVVMYRRNMHRAWQMGAHTGQDRWAQAEDFVARRRLGIVNECFVETENECGFESGYSSGDDLWV
ncbi:hypothetical protein C8R45DRAFT_331212 [Mycena sanguinolenta]|nr:hypothetical protein C8R45DRAFT_331212 [Mycena sanguinolenta]